MGNRIGRDYLGGVKFENIIKKSHPAGQGGGIFWEAFGRAKGTVIDWAKKGPLWMPFIRVQGLWAGSSHNYNGQHKKATKIAKELNTIANDFETDFYYSPYCETNHLDQNLLNDLQADFPSLIIVHTPNKNKPLAKNGILNETHGDYQPAQMDCFSYDGLSCINADSELFKQMIPRLVYFMYWTSSDNGRRNDSAAAGIPIPQRQHYTSVKMNKSVDAQASNTRAAANLPKGWLGKSHADPDTKPNPKDDNKYVMLSPIQGPFLELLNGNKVIHKLKYSGRSHEDGRYIYRSNKWGFELARKGVVLRVRLNGKVYGEVDPRFRVNEYRNHPS